MSAMVRQSTNREGIEHCAIGSANEATQVFAYDVRRLRRELALATAATIVSGGLCLAVMVVWALLGSRWREHPPLIPMPIGAEILILMMLVFNTASAMIRPRKLALRLGDESFIARPSGFVYQAGGEARFIAWQSVIGYDFAAARPQYGAFRSPGQLRIRTVGGVEMAFSPLLNNCDAWLAIVRSHAADAVELVVDTESAEALGGVELCWSGGAEGKGDRIFHRRTQANRFWLLVLPLIGIAPAILLLVLSLLGLFFIPWPEPAAAAIVLVTAYLVILRSYLVRRIRIGQDGVTLHTATKPIFVPYAGMRVDRIDGGRRIRLDGDGVRIDFDPRGYGYGSRILAAINDRRRAATSFVGVSGTADED